MSGTEDIASLGLKVDSSTVPQGTAALDAFADAGDRANSSAAGVEASSTAMAKATKSAGAAATGAAKGLQQQATAARSAQEAQIAGLLALGKATDQSLSGIKQQAAQIAAKQASDEAGVSLRALAAAYQKVTPEQNKSAAAAAGAAKTAGELKQAYRQLPAQITDIITGLVSGQKPYLVAIQQGGQLQDSFGGIGAAARAMLSVLNPVTLALGATAIAVGAVAVGAYQGQKETTALAQALTLTNNASGESVDRLEAQARAVGTVVGTTHEAAGVLAKLAASGKVAADQLQGATETAVRLEHSAGISADQTVKAFIDLGRRPTEALKGLNDQYHFLTATIYDQVRALEEQGKTSEAAALAQSTFATALTARAKDAEKQLGLLQRAAKTTGGFFKDMWDAVLDVGRPPQGIEEKLTAIDSVLERARAGGGGRINIAAAEKRRAELQKQVDAERAGAKAQADEAEKQARDIAVKDREADEARRAREQKAANAEQVRKAQQDARLSDIQRSLRAETDAYADQESILDAQRAASLISEAAYYTQRRKLVEASADATAKALDAENAALRAQSAAAAAQAQKAKNTVDSLRQQGGPDYEAAVRRLDALQNDSVATRLRNDEKIKENEADLARIRSATTAQLKVMETTEEGRLAAIARGYADARAAAESFLKTQEDAFRREEEGQGKGDKARQFAAGKNQIDDRYESQRQDLARELRDKKITEDQYRSQLAIVEEFQGKELASWERHWEALKAGDADWVKGADEAFHNYYDEAQDTAKATQTIFTDAFSGLEDALTDGLTGSKLSFKKFIDSIEQEAVRLLVVRPLLADISNALSGGAGDNGGSFIGGLAKFGSSLFGGGKATGGPIQSGHLYHVNEGGRMEALSIPGQGDYLMSDKGGDVVPNHALGGKTISVTQNFIQQAPQNQRTATQLQVQAARRMRIASARYGK